MDAALPYPLLWRSMKRNTLLIVLIVVAGLFSS